MIINKSPKPFLVLFAAILILMSLPKQTSEKMRGMTIATFAPVWESLAYLQNKVSSLFWSDEKKNNKSLQIQKLELANQHLNGQITRLEKLLLQEQVLNRQISQLKASQSLKNLQKRHKKQLQYCLSLQLQAAPAEVIFRSPSSWNSSLWINVGKDHNDKLGSVIIAKNSPVVVGTSVIGVIDYVGQRQSRVKLITDSGLSPSVRALRGDLQKKIQEDNLEAVIDQIAISETSPEESEEITKLQNHLRRRSLKEGSWLLAKGELHGNSQPLWRSLGNHLKGVGFNYDFSDEEGPARDLRSGVGEGSAVPILKKNDILVTTGMDGVFPPGLNVAQVTHVSLLREGDYYYELEARPTAGNLQEITSVFVMPPLGYDESDQPSPHDL